MVRLFQPIKSATLLSGRGKCVDCTFFYCRWPLLSVLPALTPGHEVAGDTAAVVVSMAAVEAFAVATAGEAFAVVTVEVASAVVTEVIEAVTVAGDMDEVTVTEEVGRMALASG